MTNEEQAYLNRIRMQSRGITAFQTTAYFKAKEKPGHQKGRPDLNKLYNMSCVRDLSADMGEMVDRMRKLEVPISDYCNTVWSDLSASYTRYEIRHQATGRSDFFKAYHWLSATGAGDKKRRELAAAITCAHIHEMVAMRRLYSVCLFALELPSPEPYRFFELLHEAASCTGALDRSITKQVDALAIEDPILRNLYSERLRTNTLPVVTDLPPEYGKMPTNELPIFPLVPSYQRLCHDHGAELQDSFGDSYLSKWDYCTEKQTVTIPYWKNEAALPDVQRLFQSYSHDADPEEAAFANEWDIHRLAETYLEIMDQYLSYRIKDCYPTVDSIDGCIYWAADKLDDYAFLSLHMEICGNMRTKICPICNQVFYLPTEHLSALYCSLHTEKQKETYRKKINALNGGSASPSQSADVNGQDISQFNVKVYFRSPHWPIGYQRDLTIDNETFWNYSIGYPPDFKRMQEMLIAFEATTDCYHHRIYKDLLSCYKERELALPEKHKWLLRGYKKGLSRHFPSLQDDKYDQNWLTAQITLCRLNEMQSLSFLYEVCLEELRMGESDVIRFFSLLDAAHHCMRGFENSINRQVDILDIDDPEIRTLYRKRLFEQSLSLPLISTYRYFIGKYELPKERSRSPYNRLCKDFCKIAPYHGGTNYLPIINEHDGKKLAQLFLRYMDQYLSRRLQCSHLQLHSAKRSTDWFTDRMDTFAFFYLYLEYCSNINYKVCPICHSVFISDTYHPDKRYCSAHTKRQIERYREKNSQE